MAAMTTCNRGFTLIELLVVMVIIGIIVGLATLALGQDRHAILKDEAHRVAALIELAGDEATLRGRQMGLQFTQQGFRFLLPEADSENTIRWASLEQDVLLKPRRFHPAITPTLLLDDLPHTLAPAYSEQAMPQIFLLASGERTPFRLLLASADGQLGYEVRAGPLGELQISQVTAP